MLVPNTDTTDLRRVRSASMTEAKSSSSASPKWMANAAGLSITVALLSGWQPDVVDPRISSGLRVSRSASAASPADNPRRTAPALVTRQLLAQRDRETSVIETPVRSANSRARRSVSSFLMLTVILSLHPLSL
jgi:hypothetical protein